MTKTVVMQERAFLYNANTIQGVFEQVSAIARWYGGTVRTSSNEVLKETAFGKGGWCDNSIWVATFDCATPKCKALVYAATGQGPTPPPPSF